MTYQLKPTWIVAALFCATILASAAGAEPVTVRVALKDFLSSNPNSVAHAERIEQALAEQGHEIDIEIVDVPSSGYADALGVMLLSGDVPDLIYFQGGDQKIADQGVLEDWRPWIEETEHLKDALYPHNVARLDNYPFLMHVFPLRGWQPVIRTDWLEAATGGDRPETVEDFRAMLSKIHDGGLDGASEQPYGFTAGGNLGELDGFLNPAFGIDATWLKDADGNWVHQQISNEEKVKLQFYAEMFAEGLIDPEYVTDNWEAKEDKFYTGRTGVVAASRAGNVVIYQNKMNQVHPGTTLTLLDPPKGEAGQGLIAVDVSRESRGWALSALSEHKEEAVQILDFLASDDGQLMEQLGLPGIHYTVEGDRYALTDDFGSWESPFMIASNYEPPVDLLPEPAVRFQENMKTFFIADNQFGYPAELAPTVDATDNVYKSWVFKFVSGAASFDDWSTYVDEWKAAGGDDLLTLANETLN